MANTETSTARKERRFGSGSALHVACPESLLMAIDEWRADHGGVTRSAAARDLMELGLEAEGRRVRIEAE